MSLDATRWAWLLNIRPTQKLVLLSLADRADERHMCWPSLRRLTQDTGLDTCTITAALKQLCEEGYLRRTEIPGKAYTYTLIGVSGREDAPRKNVPPAKTYPPQKRTTCKNVPPAKTYPLQKRTPCKNVPPAKTYPHPPTILHQTPLIFAERIII